MPASQALTIDDAAAARSPGRGTPDHDAQGVVHAHEPGTSNAMQTTAQTSQAIYELRKELEAQQKEMLKLRYGRSANSAWTQQWRLALRQQLAWRTAPTLPPAMGCPSQVCAMADDHLWVQLSSVRSKSTHVPPRAAEQLYAQSCAADAAGAAGAVASGAALQHCSSSSSTRCSYHRQRTLLPARHSPQHVTSAAVIRLQASVSTPSWAASVPPHSVGRFSPTRRGWSLGAGAAEVLHQTPVSTKATSWPAGQSTAQIRLPRSASLQIGADRSGQYRRYRRPAGR